MKTTISEVADKVTARLRELIVEIILHPEALEFIRIPLTSHLVLNMRAQVTDTGRIIGPKGAHFIALKTLASLMGQRAGMRVMLGRMDAPVEGAPCDSYKKVEFRQDWDAEKVRAMLERAACSSLTFPANVTVSDADKVTSVLTIYHSPREPSALVSALVEAFQVLFNAIGKANGRMLYVSAEAEVVEPPQPATADGRWAKARK